MSNKLIFTMEDFNDIFVQLEQKVNERKFVVNQLDNKDYAAGVIEGMNFVLSRVDGLLVEKWNAKATEFNEFIKEG